MNSNINLRKEIANENNQSLLPIIGTLRYLADRTRPDILVAVGECSAGGQHHPSDNHVKTAKQIMQYISNTKTLRLRLGNKLLENNPILFGFSDASYVTDSDAKSRLGGCLFFGFNTGAIYSYSKKDTTVSHSSTEAEIKAIDMLIRQIQITRQILEFIGCPQNEPTKIFVDNKSAISLAETLKTTNATKHINLRIHYIREVLNDRLIELIFIPSHLNTADALTKPLAAPTFSRHANTLLNGIDKAEFDNLCH
jgi:hypothetical protein